MAYIKTKTRLSGLGRARVNGAAYLRDTGVVLPTIIRETTALQTNGYGRGFIPPTTLPPSVVADTPPPVTPAEIRLTEVSVPVQPADADLAFEMAEAEKYGYSRTTWMSLGPARRAQIRQKFPEGRTPISSEGTPMPPVTLITTPEGATFAGVVEIDPLQVQTAEEAAGVLPANGLPAQDLVRWGLLGLAGWIFFDTFLKPKRRGYRPSPRAGRPRRRRAVYQSHKRRVRQGRQ